MRLVMLSLATSGWLLATAAGLFAQDDAAADTPTADSPATDTPADEDPSADEPSADSPSAEKPSDDNPEPGSVEVKPKTDEADEDPLSPYQTTPSSEKRDAIDGKKNADKSQDNQWRFRWHNGRWWYWLPSSKWVVWDGKAWAPYTGQAFTDRGNFGGGYYGNTYYDDGYTGSGGYYGNQYYGGSGYYGNSYYGHGGYSPNSGFRGYGYGRSSYSSGYRVGNGR